MWLWNRKRYLNKKFSMYYFKNGLVNCLGIFTRRNKVILYISRYTRFPGNKAWFMCVYQSNSDNPLHCKKILLTRLIKVATALKYTSLNYYKNCVFISFSSVWVVNKQKVIFVWCRAQKVIKVSNKIYFF